MPEWKIKKSNLLAFITDKSEKISCGNKSILQDHHEHLNCPLRAVWIFTPAILPCHAFYLYAYEPISAGRDWKKCHNYMVSEIHREYNRRFSNVKIQTDSGERQAFMETKQGLEKCLTEFLNGERRFQFRDWKEEAVLNRISGDKSRLREIRGIKNKVKYAVYRYIK